MTHQTNVSAIILCGGKSSRMGKNKAFLEIEGVPIIQRTYDVLSGLFPEILIVTNEIELFRHLEAKIYRDLIPDRGVLSGLYTGIVYSSRPHVFCVGCDMPFLKRAVIEYLLEEIKDYDVVVPKTDDGLQPLHAIYSKTCLEPIRRIIEYEGSKIIDLYPMVRTRIVEESEFRWLDPARESFFNVNTPEQLRLIQRSKPLSQG